jgi:hypothetical protein
VTFKERRFVNPDHGALTRNGCRRFQTAAPWFQIRVLEREHAQKRDRDGEPFGDIAPEMIAPPSGAMSPTAFASGGPWFVKSGNLN